MLVRKNGISTLIACQNEEVTIGWCILSFLELSDEIIVVDNGSTDKTKVIAKNIADRFPEKVRFFDKPELKDLYENRQFALEQSKYQWIVRADSDYICYTSGPNDALKLRNHLLSQESVFKPGIYSLIQPNLYLDFWHTGDNFHSGELKGRKLGGVDGRKRLPVIAPAMPRIYKWWPGFRFDRLGRTEGARIGRIAKRLVQHVTWPNPIWMHCSIKSSLNLLYRAERTNWRALGDYNKYPNLEHYLREQVQKEYGSSDLEKVADLYVQKRVIQDVRPYSPSEYYEYPDLVKEAMVHNPVYKIVKDNQGTKLKRVSDPWLGL